MSYTAPATGGHGKRCASRAREDRDRQLQYLTLMTKHCIGIGSSKTHTIAENAAAVALVEEVDTVGQVAVRETRGHRADAALYKDYDDDEEEEERIGEYFLVPPTPQRRLLRGRTAKYVVGWATRLCRRFEAQARRR